MVLENKPESSKDLASEKKTKKVKSSNSTEPAPTNIMDTTDTDNSDVDGVNINKFGAKKTSRWYRLKIDLSLKDLEKFQHVEAREYLIYRKTKPKVR